MLSFLLISRALFVAYPNIYYRANKSSLIFPLLFLLFHAIVAKTLKYIGGEEMYRVFVPLALWEKHPDREKTATELKKSGVKFIFLTVERVLKNGRIDAYAYKDELKTMTAYFRKAGFGVGIWMGESIGHGMETPLQETKYRKFVSVNGKESEQAFCPLDTCFREDLCAWITELSKAEPEIILLDDDFRMSNHQWVLSGCVCQQHLRELNAALGEQLMAEQWIERVFSGAKTIYREIWRKVQGDSLRILAVKLREAVDRVNEKIRIGLCTSPSTLGADGADHLELAQILAGKTKPFVRMFSAPYGAHRYDELGEMIDMERYLAHTAAGLGMEVVSEGDTYPRPRYFCPATYLETFDLALRADGGFDGILKYMLDYISGVEYEKGYLKRASKNVELCHRVEEAFAGKEIVGVHVFEQKDLFREMTFEGEDSVANSAVLQEQMAVRPVIRFVNNLSVPVSFSGGDVSIIFGESAKYFDFRNMKKGVVLDAEAAKVFFARGMDVGLSGWKDVCEPILTEYYRDYDKYVQGTRCDCCFTLKPGVRLLTELQGNQIFPGTYLYKNDEGVWFLVYPYSGKRTKRLEFSMNYMCQRTFVDAISLMQGKPPAAYCSGNPYLHMICGRNEEELSLLVCNLFPDSIEEPQIILGEEYKHLCCVNCTGRLERGKEILLSSLEPYACALLTVRK